MGDTAIDIFLETLKQLVTGSELSLIIEEKHQLQSLEEEIKYLRGFLKVTEKKRNDHPEVMKLVMQIRDLAAEAENIVELFVVHAFKADHASDSLREHQDRLPIKTKKNNKQHHKHHDHLSLDLETVKKGMKTLMAEVKKIYEENMYDINGVVLKQLKHSSTKSEGVSGSSKWSHTTNMVKEKVVVGFEEEEERLIEKLHNGGDGRSLEIISIIGPGGGGKTTLAKKVYDHPLTTYTFDRRVWINVSQDYDKTRKRDLLFRILESVDEEKREDYEKSIDDKLGKDMHKISKEKHEDYENSDDNLGKDIRNLKEKHEDHEKRIDDKLGEDIYKSMKGRKYLIVMDDIWDIAAWNDIQRSFPKERKGSKVLLTSRLPIQPDRVDYVLHYLPPLPRNGCWELLQKKVFGMKCCPSELVEIGEKIAEKCKGLPLAVVTIAGILASQDKTLDVWEKVAKHLSSTIAKNQEGCMEILELSYNHLPLHLKACFLYIGGYPEDYEIPIRELIWLWIAEGFIQQSERGESLETIAEGYLIDLIDRSLIQVAMKSPLGGIKACRIHDLLRELCLKKAEDDNFLVKVYEVDSFSPSATNNHRRLFIGRQFFKKFVLRHLNLRSFLCLSLVERPESEAITNLSFSGKNFELLRVLSFASNTCQEKRGIGHLVHLRYLAIAYVSYGVRPLPFSYLLNLETLNLKSLEKEINLPRDIFKMVKLRHLYTKKGVFNFKNFLREARSIGTDCSSKLDNLQTLHQMCACEACRSFLVRTPNLRKLGLHGGDSNVLRLLDLEFLKCLEKLTFTANWASDSSLGRTLLPRLKLPLTITRITLKYTCLMWEELSLLQTLLSLEVLRLMEYACVGPVWNTSELDGFPQLKYLRFYNLDIKEWIASEDQFPNLEVLVLENCRKLERIPIDFGNLNELREIKLEFCRRSAEGSAREIQEEQRKRNGDDGCLNLLAKDIRRDLEEWSEMSRVRKWH